MPMASNKIYTDPVTGQPYRVIIEHPDDFPFTPGERERDWHEASDDEWRDYMDYCNKVD